MYRLYVPYFLVPQHSCISSTTQRSTKFKWCQMQSPDVENRIIWPQSTYIQNPIIRRPLWVSRRVLISFPLLLSSPSLGPRKPWSAHVRGGEKKCVIHSGTPGTHQKSTKSLKICFQTPPGYLSGPCSTKIGILERPRGI